VAILTDAPVFRVDTAEAWTESSDLSKADWTEAANMVPVDFHKREGPEPNTLIVRATYDPGLSGPAYPSSVVRNGYERRPDGSDNDLVLPAVSVGNVTGGLPPFSLVRLYDVPAGATRFVGIVTSFNWHFPPGQPEYCIITVAEIARWHMARIGVYGQRIWQHLQETSAWLTNTLPVYNEGDKPDQRWKDGGEGDDSADLSHVPPLLNTLDGSQHTDVKDWSGFWTYGDIWNALRREYNLTGNDADGYAQGNGAVSTSKYLVWPEAIVGGTAPGEPTLERLFYDSTGADNKALDMALGGMSLCEAIDTIVTRAGGLSWACEWNDTKHKYDLYVFLTSDTDASFDGTDAITLSRGALDASVGTSPPDVAGGSLTLDWNDARNSIKALGAKKRFEVTLSTADDTLNFGWTASQQAEYITELAAGRRTERFPDVFCTYRIAENATDNQVYWDPFFVDEDFDGRRPILPEMLSRVLASDEAGTVRPVSVEIHVWRSKDGGSTWEPLHGVPVDVRPDGSICLGNEARVKRSYVTDDDKTVTDIFTWDGSSTPYDIRVTIAVESTNRLTTATSPLQASGRAQPGTYWPTLEMVEDAGDRFRGDYRSQAILYSYDADGEGGYEPRLNKDEGANTWGDHEYGSGTPEAIRNDQAALGAVAQRILDARARPRVHGELVIPPHGISWTLRPGDYIDKLTGGGGRPDVQLNAVVNGVSYTSLDSTDLAMRVGF